LYTSRPAQPSRFARLPATVSPASGRAACRNLGLGTGNCPCSSVFVRVRPCWSVAVHVRPCSSTFAVFVPVRPRWDVPTWQWAFAVESAVSRDARAERGLASGIWALRFRRLFGICDL
jgi:hypothetical protein